MALQEFTPQLRTRLNRMERAVGWFVLLATLLLAFGFGYYIYNTAERKGWFKAKAPYYTYADSGTGLSIGDPVELLGFPAGEITKIVPMPPRGPGSEHNVYIEFEIVEPNFDYLWTEGSEARVNAASFLGKRQIEVTKGTGGHTTYIHYPVQEVPVSELKGLPNQDKLRLGGEIYDGTNVVYKAGTPIATNLTELVQTAARLNITNLWIIDTTSKKKGITGVWNQQEHHFEEFSKTKHRVFELPPHEVPALNDRLQAMVSQVEAALPHFLGITNQINAVLANSAQLTSNLNVIAANARPVVSNLALISEHLREPKGSLGEWLIPTNINAGLETTLQNANLTLTNANTNIVMLADELGRSLDNLANITSNLNNQVEVNSNILTHISDIVVHSDQFIQGLKRHWLLRSAFKEKKTNAPVERPSPVSGALRSPRDEDGRRP